MPQRVLSSKKLAAIAAAVQAYWNAHAHEFPSEQDLATAPVVSFWGMAARQEAMQLRMWLQRRGLRK